MLHRTSVRLWLHQSVGIDVTGCRKPMSIKQNLGLRAENGDPVCRLRVLLQVFRDWDRLRERIITVIKSHLLNWIQLEKVHSAPIQGNPNRQEKEDCGNEPQPA